MPELPEVETVCNQVRPVVAGRTIKNIEISDPRWCAPLKVKEVSESAEGRVVVNLARRGKYIVWELEDDTYLVIHLRMTGNLLYNPVDRLYERGRFGLDDGNSIVFVDPRRFGTLQVIVGSIELEGFFSERLGVEPFSKQFTPELLQAAFKGRETSAKALLLDQRVVAGIGNIYADEALFRARINPRRKGSRVRTKEFAGLWQAVRESLQAGIDARGASIDDFRHLDGARGTFQDRFLVHRREGLPCPNCGTTIEKLRVAGRGTYRCRKCQR